MQAIDAALDDLLPFICRAFNIEHFRSRETVCDMSQDAQYLAWNDWTVSLYFSECLICGFDLPLNILRSREMLSCDYYTSG